MSYGQKYVVKIEPTNPTKSYNIVIMQQCISIKWKQRITEMKQCAKVTNKKKKRRGRIKTGLKTERYLFKYFYAFYSIYLIAR